MSNPVNLLPCCLITKFQNQGVTQLSGYLVCNRNSPLLAPCATLSMDVGCRFFVPPDEEIVEFAVWAWKSQLDRTNSCTTKTVLIVGRAFGHPPNVMMRDVGAGPTLRRFLRRLPRRGRHVSLLHWERSLLFRTPRASAARAARTEPGEPRLQVGGRAPSQAVALGRKQPLRSSHQNESTLAGRNGPLLGMEKKKSEME